MSLNSSELTGPRRARSPRHALHGGAALGTVFGLLTIFAIIGMCAAGYFWWALGVQIDAADAHASVPPAADHGGLGLIVLALSAVGCALSASTIYLRQFRRCPSVN